MKKLLLAMLLVALFSSPIYCLGFNNDYASIGFDTVALADLARKVDMDLCISFRLRLSEGFELKLPITAVAGSEGTFLDTGLMMVYYPFRTGPFISLSLLQFGFEIGQRLLDEKIISLNETCLGWTWNFIPACFAEIGLVIRNPSGTFDKEYEMIRGAFPGYSTFRVRLTLGWNFLRKKTNEQET